MTRGRETELLLTVGLVLANGDILKYMDWHELLIDHAYQRGVNQGRVNRIAGKRFDPKFLGIFRVGQRKGTKDLYLVDAQHRRAALQQREQKKLGTPKMVLCLITPNTTQKQEANLFLGTNNQKTPSQNEKFKCGLVAGHPDERAINAIVEKVGFELQFVNRRRRDDECFGNGLVAVRGLVLAYTKTRQLGNALKFLRTVCGRGNPDRVDTTIRNGEVVCAIAKFLEHTPGPASSVIKLFKAMPNFNLVNLWGEARQVKSGWKRIDACTKLLDACVGRYDSGISLVTTVQKKASGF